jgi:hypothetical protein
MKSATSTLALYALIAVIVESGLIAAASMTEGLDRTALIVGMLIVLILVVVLGAWRYTAPRDAASQGIASLWTTDHVPLPGDMAAAWRGCWHCRWTYRTPGGGLVPYVDDVIRIEEVDSRTGSLTGTGLSAYTPSSIYKVYGRVSKKRLGHLFYSSGAPHFGLAGMLILRMTPLGEVRGWWLGVGRQGGDVGGRVTWVRETTDPDFRPRVYEVEPGASTDGSP